MELRRHDFRRCRWGHNMDAGINEDGFLTGYAWSTPALREGDEVVWETAYGYAVAKVTVVKRWTDPGDMTRFSACITERHLSEESKRKIASGEVDSPPWL